MSNRDNQNKRDAGQTQQKENRENSQQNPQVTPLESPYGGADAPPYFFWREGLTAG